MLPKQVITLKELRRVLQRLIGRRGATLVEYALLAALVAIAIVVIINSFGSDVGKGMSTVGEVINR